MKTAPAPDFVLECRSRSSCVWPAGIGCTVKQLKQGIQSLLCIYVPECTAARYMALLPHNF